MSLNKSDLIKIDGLLGKQEMRFENKIENLLDKQELKFESKIDDVEQKFEDKLVEFKSDLFEKVDPILKEVTASREERIIAAEQLKRHEDRFTVIEEKLQIKPSLAG